jgi:proton-coupled amino acid transporter
LYSSDTEALIHLIKMNVGIGVMAMPSAFYNSGLVVGIVAMVFMGIITVHCMHLLV